MHFNINQVEPYPYRYDYILNIFGENVVFIKVNDKYIALVDCNVVSNTVGIMEEKEEPLWRQAMQMQMGRVPRKVKQHNTYYAKTVQFPERYNFLIFRLV